eukprot:1133114-Amphidinium_carterae.1
MASTACRASKLLSCFEPEPRLRVLERSLDQYDKRLDGDTYKSAQRFHFCKATSTWNSAAQTSSSLDDEIAARSKRNKVGN